MARKRRDGATGPAGEKEDKQDALRRIAGKRVQKAVKAISLLGNLSRYKPTPTQAKAILAALNKATESVQSRFAGNVEAVETFELP